MREARAIAQAFQSNAHPIVAQVVPTRRCNLSCAYCNEYDRVSEPVPTDEMLRRIDWLAALGTTIITLSGGEPLLHPEADAIIRRIRSHGRIATIITNGSLLSRKRIDRLNRAGLDSLQISIDNVHTDQVSMKSLTLLDRKLEWLAEDADFDVTVNCVVGGGIPTPDDALTIAQRARELGFQSTVGIIHDDEGQLRPLREREQQILSEVLRLQRPMFSFDRYSRFQEVLARGRPYEWHCRAGSRYLYVCEDGLVHYCSQQRGRPGIPLRDYTPHHLRREYQTVKSCAPYCTIGCVHRVAMVDDLRERPVETLREWFGTEDGTGTLPLAVSVLVRLFATGEERRVVRTAARWVLRVPGSKIPNPNDQIPTGPQ
jgi:MoaA/NifB/PqqE/SkfB family radical SAM enzyme